MLAARLKGSIGALEGRPGLRQQDSDYAGLVWSEYVEWRSNEPNCTCSKGHKKDAGSDGGFEFVKVLDAIIQGQRPMNELILNLPVGEQLANNVERLGPCRENNTSILWSQPRKLSKSEELGTNHFGFRKPIISD